MQGVENLSILLGKRSRNPYEVRSESSIPIPLVNPKGQASVVGESLRSKIGKRSRKTKSSSFTTQLEGKALRSGSKTTQLPLRARNSVGIPERYAFRIYDAAARLTKSSL